MSNGMKIIGNCPECGAENVELIIVDDEERLCEECVDSLYQQCDICHEYYDYSSVDFYLLKDEGGLVCEYCADDFDPDEFEEETDDD